MTSTARDAKRGSKFHKGLVIGPGTVQAMLKDKVERPRVLGGILLALVVAFGWAQWSLISLQRSPGKAPTLIIRNQEALAQALTQAPFTGLGLEDQAVTDGMVWVVGLVGCEGCDAATETALRSLERADLPAQVLLAPRSYPAPEGAAEIVAAVARSGDPALFHAWHAGSALPALISDPAEAEGYGELARQSAGRIAEVLAQNGMEGDPPFVIWRSDGTWRAMTGATGSAGRDIQRDLRH